MSLLLVIMKLKNDFYTVKKLNSGKQTEANLNNIMNLIND